MDKYVRSCNFVIVRILFFVALPFKMVTEQSVATTIGIKSEIHGATAR